MIKPIVNMNYMAMNESIATTCCYAWNGTSILGTAQVLHGGKLDATTYYKYFYPETHDEVEVKPVWMNVGIVPNWEYRSRVADVANLPYLSGGEWYDGQTALTQFGGTTLTDAGKIAWVIASPTSYFKKTVDHTEIKHIGATSAHYQWQNGNAWLVDHNAVQYSS